MEGYSATIPHCRFISRKDVELKFREPIKNDRNLNCLRIVCQKYSE